MKGKGDPDILDIFLLATPAKTAGEEGRPCQRLLCCLCPGRHGSPGFRTTGPTISLHREIHTHSRMYLPSQGGAWGINVALFSDKDAVASSASKHVVSSRAHYWS